MLQTATLHFLRDLANNNNREWFQANKTSYDVARADMEVLVGKVLEHVSTFENVADQTPKECLYRIYRDVRFSKNKLPYKRHMAASIVEGGRRSKRIDYYIHIEPNNESFIGGGMWDNIPEQLAKFRQEIDYNAAELKRIIEAPDFKQFFPIVWGEVTKTTPKGYSKDHPEIELLRRKQMFFIHKFTDEEVTSPNFVTQLVEGIKLLKPYTDFLNYLFFEEDEQSYLA